MSLDVTVAGLTFSINSSQAQQARDDLRGLTGAADDTSASVDKLVLGHQRFIAASRDLSISLAEERRQFQETTSILDQQVATLGRLRDAMLSSQDAARGFSDMRAQVEALGTAYSQTSAGIELFQQRSQALSLSSGETVTALQRITDAINNSSPGGSATRGVLEQLGINPGTDPNQANQVLQQFYQRLQSAQDGIGKFRTAEAVLGPLAPQDYAAFTAPTYETVDAQRERVYQTQQLTRLSQTTRSNDLFNRDQNLSDQRYSDEVGRYDLGNLSQTQLAELARASGANVNDLQSNFLERNLPSIFGDGTLFNFNRRDTRQPAYDYLRNNLNSPLERAARNLGDVGADALVPPGNFLDYLGSTNQAANYASVLGEYRRSVAAAGGGVFNSIRALPGFVGRFANAEFNPNFLPLQYKDPRSDVPLDEALSSPTVADQLSRFGLSDISNYQAYTGQARDLSDEGRSTIFANRYGATEGGQIQAQLIATANARAGRALTPGGEQIFAAQGQRYLGGLSQTERPGIEQLLDFISRSQIRVDPGALYASGTGDLGQAQNLLLTDQQRSSFNRYRNITSEAAQNRSASDFAFQSGQDNDLARAALGGSSALQEFKARLDAVTEATKQGNQATKEAADQADILLKKQNDIRANTQIGDAGLALGATSSEIDAGVGAGLDPSSRTRALVLAQATNGATAFARGTSNPAATAALRLPQLQAQEGQSALTGLARQISDASRGLYGTGAGARAFGGTDSDASVFSSLADVFSHIAPGASELVRQFSALADQLPRVTREVATLTSDSQNFAQARNIQLGAATTSYIAGLPLSQQGLATQQLQFLQGQVGTNPAFDYVPRGVGGLPLPQLNNDVRTAITAGAPRFGLDPNLAAAIATNEGVVKGNNIFSVIPGNVASDTAAAGRLGLQGGLGTLSGGINTGLANIASTRDQLMRYYADRPQLVTPEAIAAANHRGLGGKGVQQFIESNGVDTSGMDADQINYIRNIRGQVSPQDLLTTGRSNPATNEILNAQSEAYGATDAAGAERANQIFQSRQGNFQSQLSLLSTGQTGRASIVAAGAIDPTQTPQTGAADAAIRARQAQQDLEKQFASTTGQINQQIQSSAQLSQAWGQGYEAVTKAKEAIQLHSESLAESLTPQQNAARAAQLTAQEYQKEAEAAAETGQKQRDQIASQQFDLSLGVGTTQGNARANASFAAQQYAQSTFPTDTDAQKRYEDSQAQIELNNQEEEGLNNVRNAAKELGSTLVSTFASALQGGQTFKHFIGELAIDIGSLIEKVAFEQPLQNLFGNLLGTGNSSSLASLGSGNWLSGLPLIGSLFGTGGAAASSDIFAGAGTTDVIGGFAKGGVFPGGIRYHATGSILQTPTPFRTADGSMNIGGEAGPEVILPLRTMPNGNLGVASPGGGAAAGQMSGPLVHIEAPITIQGGQTSTGQLDGNSAAALQKHIGSLLDAKAQAWILQQLRPGGVLFRGTGAYPNGS